jgi:putative addiction module CopG family antidote
MSKTQQLSITLPSEMVCMVREKVASGEYANDSEVILDGLLFLRERDRGLEHWLRTEGVAAYDGLKANPSSGLTPEQVLAALDAETERLLTAQR